MLHLPSTHPFSTRSFHWPHQPYAFSQHLCQLPSHNRQPAYCIETKSYRCVQNQQVGWGNDFVVKTTGCSSGRLRFCCQHPRDRLQLSVTPVPGNLTPSSGSYGHQACIHIYAGKQTYIQAKHSCTLNETDESRRPENGTPP